MNKHIILGGGIAGLACAIQLIKAGFEVEIYEKSTEQRANGHAFILLENGLKALKKLGVREKILAHAHPIQQFHARSSNQIKQSIQSISKAVGLRRKVLMDTLLAELPTGIIHYNKAFSHFNYNQEGNAISAHFRDGTSAQGDIFVGADGIWSNVRKSIYPTYQLSPVRIREIVSVVKAPHLVQKWQHTFLKTSLSRGGLSVGMLPCDTEHLVWFIQYDSQHPQLHDLTIQEQKAKLSQEVSQWADPIPELLQYTDLSASYLWHTTDMETLSTFYKNNMVLIGDAAHVLLTLTSQGVSSALEDAICYTDLMSYNRSNSSLETTLKQYTFIRRKVANHFLQTGRVLREQFLAPTAKQKEVSIPLAI